MNNFEILKQAASISDGGYGVWVYDKWAEFNNKYFEGQSIVGGIFWGLTPHGGSLGYFEGWRNAITLHVSLIDPNGRNPWCQGKLMGEKMGSDVLLHEMMHQAIHQKGGDPSPHHHISQLWCDGINRLIPMIGIDTDLIAKPIKQKRVRGAGVKGNGKVTWVTPDGGMTRDTLSNFPNSLRPDGYYQT